MSVSVPYPLRNILFIIGFLMQVYELLNYVINILKQNFT